MELSSNFKQGEFNIHPKDPRLDNADYIMLVLINRYKIMDVIKEMKESKKAFRLNSISEKYGILIGTLNNAYGEFTFYINGQPIITNNTGVNIDKDDVFKKYIFEDGLSELHFDSRSYISIVNSNFPEKYYGVFYTLGDAIKVASENELVKVGEVTS